MACVFVTVILGIVLFIAIATFRTDKRAVHPNHRACPRCEHPLTPLDVETPCPECHLAAARRVRTRCYRCKYDLTGNLETDRCPECGVTKPAWHVRYASRIATPTARETRTIVVFLSGLWAAMLSAHLAAALAAWLWHALPNLMNRPPALSYRYLWRDGTFEHAALMVGAITGTVIIATLIEPPIRARFPLTALTAWAGFAVGVLVAWLDRHHHHGLARTWSLAFATIPSLAVLLLELIHARRVRQHPTPGS